MLRAFPRHVSRRAAVLDERDVLLEYESAENRAELRLLARAFCDGESYADTAAELGISVAP